MLVCMGVVGGLWHSTIHATVTMEFADHFATAFLSLCVARNVNEVFMKIAYFDALLSMGVEVRRVKHTI